MSNQEIFNHIYQNLVWGHGSGQGSEPTAAVPWTYYVNKTIEDNNVKTVLDVGCGDFRLGDTYNLSGVDYTGLEVSSLMFNQIIKHEVSNITFINDDAETWEFPQVDLILCKDVFEHLSNDSINIIMDKIMASCKIALICNDYDAENVEDIDNGDHRRMNLNADPFNYDLEELEFYGPDHKVINRWIKPA